VEAVARDGNCLFRKFRLCIAALDVVPSDVRLRIRSCGIDLQVRDNELPKTSLHC
jgi:hypothetical protein